MSRRPAAVTQADWARAIRAAEQVKPGGFIVELSAGALRVVPIGSLEPRRAVAPDSDSDEPRETDWKSKW